MASKRSKREAAKQKQESPSPTQAHLQRFKPHGEQQHLYSETIETNDLVIGIGPAGTGKTFVAVQKALEALLTNQVTHLVFCRPALEAGEKIGFLPGTLEEKINPFLVPIFDALRDTLPESTIQKYLRDKTIEMVPVAFMRGRTFKNAFVILDEAQNMTIEQMKMLLTRLGRNSKMVVNGDMSQVDLDRKVSGLTDLVKRLQKNPHPSIKVIDFHGAEILRHPIVDHVINMYDPVD